MKEANIQQLIRLKATELNATMFRINVGKGWTGNGTKKHTNGDITIKNARPFSTGVPVGYSDLSGVKPVIITPDMVGKKIGVAVFAEVKTDKGRVRDEQVNFIERMQSLGAIAGVVRSVEDFEKLIK